MTKTTSYIFKLFFLWSIVLIVTSILSFGINFFINPNKVNIGFPFKIYEEFQVSGNPYKNSGWYLKNFVLNNSIYLLVSIVLSIYISFRKKRSSKTYEFNMD